MIKLKKAILFSDIHWGKHNNLESHNQDCNEYIDWLCEKIKKDRTIDHILFLGDWFDKRDSINIATLNYAFKALEKLNSLGLPIKVLVGNHDIYHRNNTEVHSLIWFQKFENISLIEKPTICYDTEIPILLSPYLFNEEYIKLLNFTEAKIAFMHPDFNGFIITGDTIVMEHGQNPEDFKMFKRIFCGHYHKRMTKGNITYIGNCFPHNFADVNDRDRGFATYEYLTDNLEFFNYYNGPSYIKCSLSRLLKDHKTLLKEKGVVRCVVDMDISLEESAALKERFMEKYKLRELTLEETGEDLSLTGDIEIEDSNIKTTDTLVIELLEQAVVEKLDKKKLISIYGDLKI